MRPPITLSMFLSTAARVMASFMPRPARQTPQHINGRFSGHGSHAAALSSLSCLAFPSPPPAHPPSRKEIATVPRFSVVQEDFIAKLAPQVELVLYTDQMATYGEPIMDRIDPQRNIRFRLYRDSTQYHVIPNLCPRRLCCLRSTA